MTEPIEITEEMAGKIAEAVPDFTEALRKIKIQFGLLGAAMGVAAGATAAFIIAYRKAEAKYAQIAEAEIEEMREHYAAKTRALESQAAKKPVEDLVKERGYVPPDASTTSAPMAVQPPASVQASEDDATGEPDDSEMGEDEVEGANGVKTSAEPEIRNVFREHRQEPTEWDWHEERKGRSPDVPYVIHYDERHDTADYDDMTLTFYEGDDVLCNERDEVIAEDQRNLMVGEDNLEKFGHGSNDEAIVYVRNDKLEIVFEIVKSPHSYAEEVHGFSHSDAYRGNLERMRARERDEPEE